MLQDEQINHLRELKELLDSGILSEEEFAREKAKVLNTGTTKPAKREKKKSKTVWIVLGCLAGLVLITILGNLFSGNSNSSYGTDKKYEEIDNFIATLGYNSEMEIKRIGDTVYSNYTGEKDSSMDMLMGYLSGRDYGRYANSNYDDSFYQSARLGLLTAGRKNATKTAFYQCMARNKINYVYQIHGRDVFSYTWDELARYY